MNAIQGHLNKMGIPYGILTYRPAFNFYNISNKDVCKSNIREEKEEWRLGYPGSHIVFPELLDYGFTHLESKDFISYGITFNHTVQLTKNIKMPYPYCIDKNVIATAGREKSIGIAFLLNALKEKGQTPKYLIFIDDVPDTLREIMGASKRGCLEYFLQKTAIITVNYAKGQFPPQNEAFLNGEMMMQNIQREKFEKDDQNPIKDSDNVIQKIRLGFNVLKAQNPQVTTIDFLKWHFDMMPQTKHKAHLIDCIGYILTGRVWPISKKGTPHRKEVLEALGKSVKQTQQFCQTWKNILDYPYAAPLDHMTAIKNAISAGCIF